MMTTLTFALSDAAGGSPRRERAMMDVMDGCSRHRVRTSLPMKPVEPARMIFMM